jgi:hypothetical protein
MDETKQKTAGQVAYEAFMAEKIMLTRIFPDSTPKPWGELRADQQAHWDRIAQAVASHVVGQAIGGLD